MNFFERQQRARQNTLRLVVMFFILLFTFSYAMGFVVFYGWQFSNLDRPSYTYTQYNVTDDDSSSAKHDYLNSSFLKHWNNELVLSVAGFTATLLGLITLIQILFLARSAGALSEMMGATRIDASTADEKEKRYHNIVEEMALAAGIPVPLVYVLRGEEGINAFASGISPEQSAVTVTEGALELLSRDELQGVVAHEFGHILNRDVEMNIRMVGAISGLMFIARIGGEVMRVRGRRNSKDSGQIVLIGFSLFVLGWIGVLFGKILQASISREREYLADACSSQYTRNPSGLAAALAKICYRAGAGSRVENAYAEQAAHLFLAEGTSFLFGLFSTHPPILKRISLLDKRFIDSKVAEELFEKRSRDEHPIVSDLKPVRPQKIDAAKIIAMAGTLIPESNIESAMAVPSEVRAHAQRMPFAETALWAVLLSDNDAAKAKDVFLHYASDSSTLNFFIDLQKRLSEHEVATRNSIYYLAFPALRLLSVDQKKKLILNFRSAAEALGRDTVSVWCLYLHLRFTLLPAWDESMQTRAALTIRSFLPEVIQAFVWMANDKNSKADFNSVRRGLEHLTHQKVSLPPENFNPSLDQIEKAMSGLRRLPPLWKEKVVHGAWEIVIFNGEISDDEAERLRTFCAILGVPIPRMKV